MEKILIPAFIAGVISLIGFLVNMHIARKGHKENATIKKLLIRLKTEESSIALIRNNIVKTELVRVHCWGIITQFNSLLHIPRTKWDRELIAQRVDDFNSSHNEFMG